MTARLYYTDPYTTTFTARVTNRLTVDQQTAVVLDRTHFYPTSGGQPHDTGYLETPSGQRFPVHDVRVGENGVILHLVNAWPTEDEVSGHVAWPRRFDFMQHHTGQHILSQACLRLAEAPTVGFHLTPENATIDIECAELSAERCERIERLANQVIWENRPITAVTVSQDEALRRNVRKIPDLAGERLRLVTIADFDETACGGTHVGHTGAVGLVKIIRQERRGGILRLEFRCGERARVDYDEKNALLRQLTALFTTGRAELPAAATRLQAELKAALRENRRLVAAEQAWQAEQLLAAAQAHEHGRLVCRLVTPAMDLRAVARQLAASDGVVALLAAGGERSELVFARAENAVGDMNALLQTAVRHLGRAGGGGQATFAQGGGPPHPPERLQSALDLAATAWRTTGSGT